MKAKVIGIIDKNTIKAISESFKQHKKYGKFITSTKKFLVETNNVNVKIGQEIEIISSKPFSKRKTWIIK
jgi:small subunit ribosomal protein S17